MKEKIIIFGTGGHAKVVFDIVESEEKYSCETFYSINENLKTFLSRPHFNQSELKNSKIKKGIVAIGDNAKRKEVVELILKIIPDFEFVSAIHPTAVISPIETTIGSGSVVMANVVINPGTIIGNHVIVNTSSSIDHDCTLKDFSSVAPGVTLGGNVTLKESSIVSLGSKIIHGIIIGEGALIGAGALIRKEVQDYEVWYGIPAKKIKKRNHGDKYL